MTKNRHRVVIVDCGFGDLFPAPALRHAGADVTVIHRNNHPLFQPPLYQSALAIPAEGDIARRISALANWILGLLGRERPRRVSTAMAGLCPRSARGAVGACGHSTHSGQDDGSKE